MTKVAELIERLNEDAADVERFIGLNAHYVAGNIRKSATLLASQEAEIAELRVALALARHRKGTTAAAVIEAFNDQHEWLVADLSKRIKSTHKELYNALGYLTRKKRIRRTAYGKYARAALRPAETGEGQPCDHNHYDSAKHGRRCTCGVSMWDAGD